MYMCISKTFFIFMSKICAKCYDLFSVQLITVHLTQSVSNIKTCW